MVGQDNKFINLHAEISRAMLRFPGCLSLFILQINAQEGFFVYD